MATNFPGGIDTFVNPNSTSSLDSPSHSGLHTDLGDAMTAVQTELVNNPYGLVHLNTTTMTAVASQSFNNVFTNTYDIYRILVRLDNLSGSQADISLRMRNAGTDETSSNYHQCGFFMVSSGTSLTGQNVSAATTWTPTFSAGATDGQTFLEITIASPKLTKRTNYIAQTSRWDSDAVPGTAGLLHRIGALNNATSYDGFTMFTTSNMTGLVTVYGQRKS
jgi:hypothetical protein